MRINVCDHDDVSDTASPAGRYTLLALCIGAILNAALSATAGASESSDLRDVEQVIVTARKVNERLQDVPVSITAISAEQLQQRGAVDLKDVVRTIPGVTFGGVDRGQSVYTIRGVASGLDTTGIYLDDISLLSKRGNEGAFDPVFFDMERLEVLKGPQGTLYGGSAMGGAIKYVSAKPNLSESGGSAAAGVATTEHGSPSYNGEGILNLPLVNDVLAVRMGGYYQHEGGYIDNIAGLTVDNPTVSTTPSPVYTPQILPSLSQATKEDYNSADTYVGRFSLLWRPDPSWSIRPAVFYQDYKSDNPSTFFPALGELTSTYRNVGQESHDRTGIYSLDISKSWGDLQLTSLTAYVDRMFRWKRDFSFFVGALSPPDYPYESLANYPATIKTFSQEFRISSSSNERLTWTVGAHYRDQDGKYNPVVDVFGGAALQGRILNGNRGSTLKETAAFGEATYTLVGGLALTAGVRLFEIEQSSFTRDTGPVGDAPADLASKEDGVNPKYGVSYKFDPDHMVYASAAEGYRPGGPLPLAFTASCGPDFERLGLSGPPSEYKSDDLWTYELGSKNQFNDGRLTLNGALYQTDWKDIQQLILLPTCGQRFTGNGGEARVRGAEIETQINLISDLQLGANATYTDAEIIDPGLFTTTFQKGDEIQNASKWMVSAFGAYSMPLFEKWELQIRADYQYRSKARLQYASTQQVVYSDGLGTVPVEALFMDGYDLANASMSLDNGQRSFRLYINNLFDDQPILDTDRTALLHTRSSTLRPRTVGLEVRQRF